MPASTISPDDRAKIIQHARIHGAPAAAAHHHISLATLRSWIARAKISPAPDDAPEHASPHASHDAPHASSRDEEVVTREPVSVAVPRRKARARRTGDESERRETYVDSLRSQCERLIGAVGRLRLTPQTIHRAAAAVEKLERAGRVPFGYGSSDGNGERALINVSIHNQAGRGGDLPPVIDVTPSAGELPAVASEIEQPAQELAQVLEAEDTESQ